MRHFAYATFFLLLAAYGALGAGCKRARTWPPEPVPVTLGEDACAGCKMIVSDARFGAQLIERSGKVEQFDDLGCLLQRHRRESLEPEGIFVRTWPAGAWIRGDQAWLLSARDVPSPMGYGFAAFVDEQSARAEAARHHGSSVLSFSRTLRESLLISRGEP